MATTKLGLPEITGNMTADVPRDMNALARAVDNKVGVANGLATLGADGKVPATQLNVSALATKTEVQTVNNAVQSVNTALTTHKNDDTKHLQAGERDSWNAKQNALPVEQKRNIYISSAAPSNPVDGDIWIEV